MTQLANTDSKYDRKKPLDIFRYKGEPVKITLGTITLVCLCSFLIVIATFTQISFSHYVIPADLFSYFDADFSDPNVSSKFIKYYRYIPQIPVILFIAGLLGRSFGIISVLIYIIIGLFFYPVFALGGGLKYLFEYNLGYILAYIPAVFFANLIVKDRFSFKNILKAVFVGVLIIHIVGVLYTFLIGIITHQKIEIILGWLVAQSGVKIIYDMVFGVIAMLLANLAKKILWITMC